MAFHLIILLSDSSPIISLSCLVTQSVSQPPLPKLPNQIKLNFAQYLSKLLHVFLILFFLKFYMHLSVLTWTYRPLANPTKLKFDQEFDLFWSSNFIKATNVCVHCAFGTLFRVDMCNNRKSWGPVNPSLFCQCPYYPFARYQFEHQTQLNSNYRFCVSNLNKWVQVSDKQGWNLTRVW